MSIYLDGIKSAKNLTLKKLIELNAINKGDKLKLKGLDEYCTVLAGGDVKSDGEVWTLNEWAKFFKNVKTINVYREVILVETGELLDSVRERVFFKLQENRDNINEIKEGNKIVRDRTPELKEKKSKISPLVEKELEGFVEKDKRELSKVKRDKKHLEENNNQTVYTPKEEKEIKYILIDNNEKYSGKVYKFIDWETTLVNVLNFINEKRPKYLSELKEKVLEGIDFGFESDGGFKSYHIIRTLNNKERIYMSLTSSQSKAFIEYLLQENNMKWG